MTTLSRHLDQRAVVQAVLLGIRAGVEQKPHRFDMSFARRKVHGRCVPVSGSSETRMVLEQSSQCRNVAGGRGDDDIPRLAAVRGFQFDRLNRRAPPGEALDKRLELRPAVEAVGARDHELRVVQGKRVSVRATVVRLDLGDSIGDAGAKGVEQFFRLTFELVEMGRSRGASRASVAEGTIGADIGANGRENQGSLMGGRDLPTHPVAGRSESLWRFRGPPRTRLCPRPMMATNSVRFGVIAPRRRRGPVSARRSGGRR